MSTQTKYIIPPYDGGSIPPNSLVLEPITGTLVNGELEVTTSFTSGQYVWVAGMDTTVTTGSAESACIASDGVITTSGALTIIGGTTRSFRAIVIGRLDD